MARGYDLRDQSKSKRRQPKEPASEDESNIYYWWYQYLRANDVYLQCCTSGGTSSDKDIVKTYEDFGDVRSGNFKEWWATGGQRLFELPDAASVQLYSDGMILKGPHVRIVVPLEQELNESVKQLRTLISKSVQFHRSRIDARLKPKKTLESQLKPDQLKTNLALHLAKLANPTSSWQEWAKEVGVTNSDLRALEIDVSRRIRIAKQIIHNAGKGIFPKYDKR